MPDLDRLDALLMDIDSVHGVGGTPDLYEIWILHDDVRDRVLELLRREGFAGEVEYHVGPRGRLL